MKKIPSGFTAAVYKRPLGLQVFQTRPPNSSGMRSAILALLLHVVATRSQYHLRILNGDAVGELSGEAVVNNGDFRYLTHLETVSEGSLANGTKYIKITSCGGSIIELSVILTAAHCIKTSSPDDILVYAGALHKRLKYFEPGLQIPAVRRFVIHEDFNRTFMDSDVALLFLEEPLIRSKYVDTIRLPTSWHYALGVQGTVAGWGYDENGESTDWLHKARLVQFPRKLAQTQTNYTITERMMAAVDPSHVWSVCKGDSGGALVVLDRIVGIISWALNGVALADNKITCDPKSPGIFVDVLHFIPWIKSKIREDADWVARNEGS